MFVLAGLAGSVLALARRRGSDRERSHGLALACLLFTATAATILLAPDVFEFSWRYQLPAIVTLPAAGVLGVAGWLGRRQERRQVPLSADPVPPAEQAPAEQAPSERVPSDPQPQAPLP